LEWISAQLCRFCAEDYAICLKLVADSMFKSGVFSANLYLTDQNQYNALLLRVEEVDVEAKCWHEGQPKNRAKLTRENTIKHAIQANASVPD